MRWPASTDAAELTTIPAPRPARRRATAAPMPLVEPVTMIALLVRFTNGFRSAGSSALDREPSHRQCAPVIKPGIRLMNENRRSARSPVRSRRLRRNTQVNVMARAAAAVAAAQPLFAQPPAAWHTGLVLGDAWDRHAGE